MQDTGEVTKHPSKTQQEALQEVLTYDPNTGEVRMIRSGRLLLPDDEGFALVFNKDHTPKLQRVKLDKIALLLSGIKVRKNQAVLHRNLDTKDNRLQNLLVVSKSIYKSIQEALMNLDYAIKLEPHPDDQWAYVLSWREDGKVRRKVISDIVSAKKVALRLKLKASKIVTKYCIFDNKSDNTFNTLN